MLSPLLPSCHPQASPLDWWASVPSPLSLLPPGAVWLLLEHEVVCLAGDCSWPCPGEGTSAPCRSGTNLGHPVCHTAVTVPSACASSAAATALYRCLQTPEGIWQLSVTVLPADEQHLEGQEMQGTGRAFPGCHMASLCCCPAGGVWGGRDPSLQVSEGSELCWMAAEALGLCWRSRWYFGTCVAPSLMEQPLCCSWAFYFTAGNESAQEPAGSLGTWLFPPIIAAEMQAISTSSFQGASQGSSSPWLHHLSYQYITLLID